jgi:hypothetical protein
MNPSINAQGNKENRRNQLIARSQYNLTIQKRNENTLKSFNITKLENFANNTY